MQRNSFSKLTIYSMIGLVIGVISLVWGFWVENPIGGHLSGLDLWLSLRIALLSPEINPDTNRQQIIFICLTSILAGIALQGILTIFIFNQRKVKAWFVSAVLWALMLASTFVLLVGYKALVSGVLWLAVGCAVAFFGEVSVMVGGLTIKESSHSQTISGAIDRWSSILDEASQKNTPFAVLAVRTNPEINYEELQILQTELRGRDLLYPVKNGLFILLWQNTPVNTPMIANKLLSVLQGHSTRQVQIGSACYPADGDNLKLLLTLATLALESAQKVGGSVIIPFSTPSNKDALSGLALWESLMAEVRSTRTPAVILSFKTNRPLNLAETHRIQNEVRGRDQVSAYGNGFYVFLWNTSREGGQIVLNKLQSILKYSNIENHAIMAVLPEDGENLPTLFKNLTGE